MTAGTHTDDMRHVPLRDIVAALDAELRTADIADYPPDAIAGHEEGGTGVTVVLSETGEVISASVAYASGVASLDEKAVQLAKSTAFTARNSG